MAKAPKKTTGGRTRKTSGGSKRRPVRRKGYGWPARFLALGLLLVLVGGVYLVYLDAQVRGKFEGKRWAVPARVYGRALELYTGAKITGEQLEAELTRLGYRKVTHPKSDASWSRNGNRYLVRTRGFQFWDGKEPARYLDIRFAGGSVERIAGSRGEDFPLVRLEAPEIGSIYPSHNEDRVLVQRGALPGLLVDGLIAMEDRTFYRHHGVDPKAIARAVWANLRAGGVVQGGSTLTQQLVKNFYLTRERSLGRKLNEALMALLLDYHYAKPDILEAYANEIYLGQDGSRAIHGFGLASHFYFNMPLEELDLPRLALLVALVRGPSYYDPRRHPERALKRRNLVLEVMHEQNMITLQERRRAAAAKLGVTDIAGKGGGSYPAFMDLVRRQLHRDYREEDLTSEGLRIFTTLDPWIQRQAEQAISSRLAALERNHGLPAGKLESAAVLADTQSGEVVAVVGGRNAGYAGFNRALDAVRPIGSLIKPVVYLAALMDPARFSLVTRVADSPLTLRGENGKSWSPGNYDNRSHGEVTLHEALTHSYNLATVRLGLDIGLDDVVDLLSALGSKRPATPVPALLLGAVSLSPIEVAQIYQTFAAGGFYSPLRAIREVQAGDGTPLQRYPLTVHQVVDAGVVYLLSRNLQTVVRSGTGRGLANFLSPDLNVAGKTGTTNDLRDSWFAGFTGDKVAVVWLGRDDNQPAKLSGAAGALRIWGDIMRRIAPLPLDLLRPESVEIQWIDPASGFLADEGCEGAEEFPFIRGFAPATYSSCARRSGSTVNQFFRSLFE